MLRKIQKRIVIEYDKTLRAFPRLAKSHSGAYQLWGIVLGGKPTARNCRPDKNATRNHESAEADQRPSLFGGTAFPEQSDLAIATIFFPITCSQLKRKRFNTLSDACSAGQEA
ncbi:hypothetical protein [Chelativorans sp. AA-79]|uniref:hypothetical protein n=1 Tax=Chelativorans sp. AA-79 TaxID=3028735 RepID=UPI0023F8A49A|nr:hypothetical protein [Chelativorans sp. AA-79]WEX10089.1 hypothetical protein PVE73_03745 [Chelativorans sp. AA-79]